MSKTFFLFLFLPFYILADENFSCQKKIEENNLFTHCLNKLSTYPMPVHFYIPKKLNLEKPINMNVHFHGHNIGYSHFDKKYGDYGTYLANSSSNSVLVIPESSGKCETYDQYFSSKEKTLNFFKESKNVFSPSEIAILTLSGHSGAYRVLNTIFGYPKIEEDLKIKITGVALLDATYGSTINIENFAMKKYKTGNSFLFFDAFVSGSKATAEPRSLDLKKKFSSLELNAPLEVKDPSCDCVHKPSEAGKLSKFLLEKKFKFVSLKSSDYPASTPGIDLHFGILREHGIKEFLGSIDNDI